MVKRYGSTIKYHGVLGQLYNGTTTTIPWYNQWLYHGTSSGCTMVLTTGCTMV